MGEHAHTLTDLEPARRLQRRLRDARVVAVVGGGLTGIEAAAELAESLPALKVRLVTDGAFGEALSPRGRRHLYRAFARLGIDVRDRVRVGEVRADGVVLGGGEQVAADTVVWTTGFRVPKLAADAGLAVDRHGRMLVDATMRSVSHPDVYGVGDAAAAHRPDGLQLRMACATGMPAAQHAIRAITQRATGTEPSPLRFRYLNQCISIGRRDRIIQFAHADDSPRPSVLTGRVAALYKETVVHGAALAQRHPRLPTVPA